MTACFQPQLPYAAAQLTSSAGGGVCCFRFASTAQGYYLPPPLPSAGHQLRVTAPTRVMASYGHATRCCARAEQVLHGGSRARGVSVVGRNAAVQLSSSAGRPAAVVVQAAAESLLLPGRLHEDVLAVQALLRRLSRSCCHPDPDDRRRSVTSCRADAAEGSWCSELGVSVFQSPPSKAYRRVSNVIRPQFDPAPEVNPSVTPGPSVPDPNLPAADPSSPRPSTPPEFRPDVAPSESPSPAETTPGVTPTPIPNPSSPPELPDVRPLEIPDPPAKTPVPEVSPVPFPSPEVPNPTPSTWPSSPPLEVPSPHPSIPEISFRASWMSAGLPSLHPCVAGLLLPWAIMVEPAHASLLSLSPKASLIQEAGTAQVTVLSGSVPRGPPISPPNTPPLTPPGVPTPTPPPSTPPIPPPGAPPPTLPPQTPPIPPGEPGPLPPPTTPPTPPGGVPLPGPSEFPPTPSSGPQIFPPGCQHWI